MNLGNSAAERLSTNQSSASIGRDEERSVTEQKTGNSERPAVQQDTPPKPDTSVSRSPAKPPDTSPQTADNKIGDHDSEVQANTAADSTDGPSAATASASTQQANPARATDEPTGDDQPSNPTASPHVARAQLTRRVEKLEPLDRVVGVFHSEGKQIRRLNYFTDLRNLRGEKVEHNWWHEGRLIATVTSRVGSNSWRMHSSKKLIPSMAGPWRVVLNDGQGETLSVAEFVYKVP